LASDTLFRLACPSLLARRIDEVVGLAGLVLVGVSLLDAVASFWHDEVVIYPAALERVAGVVLVLGWPWIMVSAWMIYGTPRRRGRSWSAGSWRPSWRRVAPWLGAFGVVVVVIVVGFVLGAAKGSLHVLPGGVHQVSTLDLNSARWTTVSPAEYQVWAARFIPDAPC
jgi:hypothetical protein